METLKVLRMNLQLFGGRGSNSNGGKGGGSSSSSGDSNSGGGGGGTFASEADFEKSLTDFNDPRLKEYTKAQEDFTSSYGTTQGLINSAKANGISEWTAKSLNTDKKNLQEKINNMPKMKTPGQLGEVAAMKEYISAIDTALSYKDNKAKSPTEGINIVN